MVFSFHWGTVWSCLVAVATCVSRSQRRAAACACACSSRGGASEDAFIWILSRPNLLRSSSQRLLLVPAMFACIVPLWGRCSLVASSRLRLEAFVCLRRRFAVGCSALLSSGAGGPLAARGWLACLAYAK